VCAGEKQNDEGFTTPVGRGQNCPVWENQKSGKAGCLQGVVGSTRRKKKKGEKKLWGGHSRLGRSPGCGRDGKTTLGGREQRERTREHPMGVRARKMKSTGGVGRARSGAGRKTVPTEKREVRKIGQVAAKKSETKRELKIFADRWQSDSRSRGAEICFARQRNGDQGGQGVRFGGRSKTLLSAREGGNALGEKAAVRAWLTSDPGGLGWGWGGGGGGQSKQYEGQAWGSQLSNKLW